MSSEQLEVVEVEEVEEIPPLARTTSGEAQMRLVETGAVPAVNVDSVFPLQTSPSSTSGAAALRRRRTSWRTQRPATGRGGTVGSFFSCEF